MAVRPLPGEPVRIPSATGPSLSLQLDGRYYSVTTFLAWQDYSRTRRRSRVVLVLLLTLIPALLLAMVPSLVTLRNPALGLEVNIVAIWHCVFLIVIVTFGMVLTIIGGTGVPRPMYSPFEAVGLSIITGVIFFGIIRLMIQVWRFPIPFSIITMSPPWGVIVVVMHYVLLHHKIKRFPTLLPAILRYRWALVIQCFQMLIYVALTVAFDSATRLFQLALIGAYPIAKYFLKQLMRKATRSLGERSNEVAVATIEICASLYQSMIMQTSSSTLAICFIIGLDLLQGILTITMFIGRGHKTPSNELFAKSMSILTRYRTPEPGGFDMKALQTAVSGEDAIVVKEALEVATTIEAVLLVEYFEVSVPILNALFLLATYRSTSTMYNTRSYMFYEKWSVVRNSTVSILAYSLLQALSLVVMHVVLRRRYAISAIWHLAFVLEHRATSIQGKLITFLPVMMYFTVIHYGEYESDSNSRTL